MLCSDLERYLEAFLDGRLGRSRTTILRRHLGLCGPCRARVERLRRFEREIGRQIGATAGEVPPSVWQGLEIDLVRSLSLAGTDLIPLLRPGPPGLPRLRPPTARAQPRQAPPPPLHRTGCAAGPRAWPACWRWHLPSAPSTSSPGPG